jgi:hypothetical protein
MCPRDTPYEMNSQRTKKGSVSAAPGLTLSRQKSQDVREGRAFCVIYSILGHSSDCTPLLHDTAVCELSSLNEVNTQPNTSVTFSWMVLLTPLINKMFE